MTDPEQDHYEMLRNSKDASNFEESMHAVLQLMHEDPSKACVYAYRAAKMFARFVPSLPFQKMYECVVTAARFKDYEVLGKALYHAAKMEGTLAHARIVPKKELN